jgi:hypothetical protein
VKFFFDNNIAFHMAKALNALGERQGYPPIVSQREMAGDSPLSGHTKDWQWMPRLAAQNEGWIIVSGDVNISKRMHEKAAWLESGLTAFFLGDGWADRKFWDQIMILMRWWPRIVEQARATPKGAGYIVPLSGNEFRVLRMAEIKNGLAKRVQRFDR